MQWRTRLAVKATGDMPCAMPRRDLAGHGPFRLFYDGAINMHAISGG
jgi:hypothetical protein